MTTNTAITASGDQTIHAHSGGDLQVLVTGTFDGATVELKAELSDSSGYEVVPDTLVKGASVDIYTLKAGNYRATVAGVGASTSLTVDLK